jgi:DNA-binding transcriptional LysR family regulator
MRFMAEVDLNLLRVFDVLMETGSVTRTATRLSLTQSAISHALGRLRHALRDPLFVRTPRGLQPTARAREIHPGIRDALLQLRGTLSPTHFNPADVKKRFTISGTSYFCAVMLPELLAHTRKVAPGISFMVVPQTPDLLNSLDEGVVDLAVGSFGRIPRRLMHETLFEENLVWIASATNKFRHDPPVWRDIADNPRLTIMASRVYSGLTSYASEGGLEQRLLADNEGVQDDANTRVHDLITAMAVVERTDLVTLTVRRVAQQYAKSHRLVLIEPVQKNEPLKVTMLWHKRLAPDAGLAWLRQTLRTIADPAGEKDPSGRQGKNHPIKRPQR